VEAARAMTVTSVQEVTVAWESASTLIREVENWAALAEREAHERC
jgi:hypothetical protein